MAVLPLEAARIRALREHERRIEFAPAYAAAWWARQWCTEFFA